MKELVMHLGYPKTGTTSVQETFFRLLQEKELISYKGKSVLFETEEGLVYNQIFRHLVLGEEAPTLPELDSSKVNVVSKEGFLWDGVLFGDENKFAQKLVFADLLERLCLFFEERSIKLKFVITIRSQVDLLYSTYLHNIVKDRIKKRFNSFNDFLEFLKQDQTEKDHFNFNYVYERMVEKVGSENIKILLFEELKNNPTHFYSELSDFIGVNWMEVEKSFDFENKLNDNKKYSKDKTTVASYKGKKKGLRRFIYKMKFIRGVINQLNLTKAIKNLFEITGVLKVTVYPKPSAIEISEIREIYNASNRSLCEKTKLKSMINYNYFD